MTVLSVNGLKHAPIYGFRIVHVKKNLEGLSQEECREYPSAELGWASKKNKKTGRFSE